jgi:hypothetical protein
VDILNRRFLIHFEEEDISDMSETEIRMRIEALLEIEDAPHFMWKMPPESPEFANRINQYYQDKLNGSAGWYIYLLEEELNARKAAEALKKSLLT